MSKVGVGTDYYTSWARMWFHIMFKNIFLYLIIKENLLLVGAHVHAACLDSPDQATSIYCMHMPTYM